MLTIYINTVQIEAVVTLASAPSGLTEFGFPHGLNYIHAPIPGASLFV